MFFNLSSLWFGITAGSIARSDCSSEEAIRSIKCSRWNSNWSLCQDIKPRTWNTTTLLNCFIFIQEGIYIYSSTNLWKLAHLDKFYLVIPLSLSIDPFWHLQILLTIDVASNLENMNSAYTRKEKNKVFIHKVMVH
jgi:hypothetical protein